MSDGSDKVDAATLDVRGAEPPRGATLRLLVVGDDVFESHELPESGRVILGRAAGSDIRIDDPSISRAHAVLHIGEPLRVEDLGGVNGTCVGDRRLVTGEAVAIDVDQAVQLGRVTLIVQRRAAPSRPRQLWSHGYFEARVAEECARGARSRRGLTVAVVRVAGAVDEEAARAAFVAALRDSDIVGLYAPGTYEVALVGAPSKEAAAVVERLRLELAAGGCEVAIGTSAYPADGLDAGELLARAHASAGGGDPGSGERSVVVASQRMRDLRDLARRVARGDLPILLVGETGVGKEIIAELVHESSPRAHAPFLRLNCAALPETLLESELFGHEKGAFTGADRKRVGLLESHDGGTVFLDEVGEIPLATQAKLLRVLEGQMVLPVGGSTPRAIDVRFVAATNRNLDAAIRERAFREDLYYRLSGITIAIPPLRDRPEEIAPLTRHFTELAAGRLGLARPPAWDEAAMTLMERYGWPGNVRELRNAVDRAVLLAGTKGTIAAEHLPADKMESTYRATSAVAATTWTRAADDRAPPTGLDPEQLEERDEIIAALARCGGNQTQAAKVLGISRRTLVNRLDTYAIPRPQRGRRRS